MNGRRLALLAILLAACGSLPTPTPAASSAPSETPIARPQIISTQTPRPIFASLTPSLVPLVLPTATLTPTYTGSGVATWTPLPQATMLRSASHLWLQWPLFYGAATLSRVYPYGGTNGRRLQVHHGVDLIRPAGTAILAAADGTVFYAGNDFSTLFGSYTNYYGNLVVIQHPFLSPDGLTVFTLYGHMEHVIVGAGQTVRQGEQIGTVGSSGIALGPHLHFEVRLGSAYDFDATRNPELWLQPPDDHGLLAGRVIDPYGRRVDGVTVEVQSSRTRFSAPTYGDQSVNSDDSFGENFALGNLVSETYAVSVRIDGRERFAQSVFVYPGSMTWIDVQLSP